MLVTTEDALRRRRRPRRWVAAVAALVAAALSLTAAAAAGLGVPDLLRLGGADRTSLDYSTTPGHTFPRLRNGFIAAVLGDVIPDPASPGSLLGGASGGGSGAAGTAGAPGDVQPVVVTHPFTNDTFANAYGVPSVPFTAHTTTVTATRDGSAEPATCSPVGGTAWYRYTPPVSMGLVADTFGTDYPVALAVFTGSSETDLTQVGCDKSATGNAQVGFAATRGTTYSIQVTGIAHGGHLVFTLAPIGRTSATTSPPGNSSDGLFVVTTTPDGRYVAFDSGSTNLDPAHPPKTCVTSANETCNSVYVTDTSSGVTRMVSLSNQGQPGSGHSDYPSISADGRYVAFTSTASDLVSGDTNGFSDIFVRDTWAGTTTRESLTASNQQSVLGPNSGPDGVLDYGSIDPSMSADGRYIAFISNTLDMTLDDRCSPTPADHRTANSCYHVYLRDRVARTTTLVDSGPLGAADGDASDAVISADGSHVYFVSQAASLVAGAQSTCTEAQDCWEVYAWDRATRHVALASVSAAGVPANASAPQAGMSVTPDGGRVAFVDAASNLVPGDTNGTQDVFVHDLRGATARVSVSSSGAQASDTGGANTSGVPIPTASTSRATAMTSDGELIFFTSQATGLVPEQTGGQVQLFRHDMLTGATTLVSLSSTAQPGNGGSALPAPTADGAVVYFTSASTNLGAGCTGCNAAQFATLVTHVIPEGGL